ncbi:hypothetical protein ACP26L_12665 [Paenibacillus sp. S-38]|uniref:hypothetical protein n=1 Tax=Paenibacillus sp. S-38 TaxID=3416710 RepID=UPI003CE6FEDE
MSSGLEIRYNERLRVRIISDGAEESHSLRKQAFQAVLTELVWSVRDPKENPAAEPQQKALWTWILQEIGWALIHASPFQANREDGPLTVLASVAHALQQEEIQEGTT